MPGPSAELRRHPEYRYFLSPGCGFWCNSKEASASVSETVCGFPPLSNNKNAMKTFFLKKSFTIEQSLMAPSQTVYFRKSVHVVFT